MSRPKVSGQCISKGINFSLAYILQSNRDTIGLLLNTHLLYTVQDPFSTVRQSCSKTTFTLFSLFFGGPSLSITDQDWGRDFVDDANTIVDQQLVTHLLCTVQDPFSTVRQSSFQNSFHTLPFVFFGRPSLSITDQDWERDFMGDANSIAGQLLVTPSLVHSSRSV